MPVTLYIYKMLTRLSAPILPLLFYLRRRAGREDAGRLYERRGFPGMARPQGHLIWVHAASVGEVLSVIPLIREILALTEMENKDTPNRQQTQILLTTGTVTSAEIVARHAHPRIIHQYVPVDYPAYASRFIDHWQPDMAIFVESEIWPNLLACAKRRNMPMALVNARMSSKSFTSWKKIPVTIAALLGQFDLIFAQDELSGDRLKKLGAKDVQVTGNIKFDAPPLVVDRAALTDLHAAIGQRPVWLAASTHPGEEAMIANAHQALKPSHPDLLSIIAPRHPARGAELAEGLRKTGLTIAQRSQGEAITAATDIYLADTIGEMGLFYRLVEIAFIGGTLVPHGGQNPTEPARLDTALINGPYVDNFRAIFDELKSGEATRFINDQKALNDTVNLLLSDNGFRSKMIANSRAVADRSGGAVARSMAGLKKILPFTTPDS